MAKVFAALVLGMFLYTSAFAEDVSQRLSGKWQSACQPTPNDMIPRSQMNNVEFVGLKLRMMTLLFNDTDCKILRDPILTEWTMSDQGDSPYLVGAVQVHEKLDKLTTYVFNDEAADGKMREHTKGYDLSNKNIDEIISLVSDQGQFIDKGEDSFFGIKEYKDLFVFTSNADEFLGCKSSPVGANGYPIEADPNTVFKKLR
jgi:hypothetical protein